MAAPTAPVRILLVDDNIDHVQLALRSLRGESTWKVDTVRLGSEALHRVEEHAFDVILLDYRLPDTTGLEVLARLRATKPDLAVVLMTSQGSEEVAMQALRAGATSYVVKNGEFGKRLAFEIREWLARRGGA